MGEWVLGSLIAAATLAVLWQMRRGPADAQRGHAWLRHPGTWLAAVVAAMLVNQLLVTAYVDQAWHGSPERIARYLPPGWFDLAGIGPLSTWLPAWPWTVLHVQAALELPFVMLAYLLVCRWFGADVFRRAIAARWLVSASYTATFCLVEWELRNPYTVVDLMIRVVCGVLTPLLLPLLSEGRVGPPRLIPFVASAAALGCVVLAVYDTATLYNLAHAVSWLPLTAVAAAVLAGARWWARRPAAHGPAMASVSCSLGWFLLLFFIPALPVRYGFNFGIAPVSLIAGAALVLMALWRGWDHQLGGTLAVAAGAGVLGAGAGYVVAHGYSEAKLLAAATGFVLTGAAACAALDHARR